VKLHNLTAWECDCLFQTAHISGWYGLGQEAHKSLDVLRYHGQEELLANKPQAMQAQAPPSDLIFEFASAPCLRSNSSARPVHRG